MCGLASWALMESLQNFGYEDACVIWGNFIHESEPPAWHCWVEFKGMIIDITSTQFEGRKKVTLIKRCAPRYRCLRIVHSRDYFNGWGNSRTVTEEKLNHLVICP